MNTNDTSTSWKMTKFSELHVLIVDDEPLIVKTIEIVLRELGITAFYTAGNGAEALDHFAGGTDVIDLIICDWMMPEMNGLQFLQRLRGKHLKTPFVMLTSRKEADDIVAAKKLGVTAYIAKPFSAAQLKNKMEMLVTKLLKEKESE